MQEIIGLMRHAADDPARYPMAKARVRRIVSQRFPYSVFFLPDAGKITVVAVFHFKRNPLAWQGRA